MVRYLFYTIGDLTYQSSLVERSSTSLHCVETSFVSDYGPVVRQIAEWMMTE